MSYNILRGGSAIAGGDARLDDILALIGQHSPDILALQEANGFQEIAVLQRFATALALPYYAFSEGALYSDGARYHVVLFSRYPIHDVHRFPECSLESAAIFAVIDTPMGPVSVCNVHLHSTSESRRMVELACLLNYAKSENNHMFLGDLNAISRADAYDTSAGEFELRTDVTDRLGRELVDIGAAFAVGPTHPSRLPADHCRAVSRRIDYVFASAGLAGQVCDAQAVRCKLAHRSSDHFPLLVTFDAMQIRHAQALLPGAGVQ